MATQSMNAWIDSKVKEMKNQIKKNRKKYFLLSGILMLLNLITLTVATIAIDMLWSDVGFSTSMLLAIFSAIAIIVSFFINALVILWKGIMKDKIYTEAIDKLQHERMLHAHTTKKYKGKDKDKILEENARKIYEKATSKLKKKKASLLLRMFTGGNDV